MSSCEVFGFTHTHTHTYIYWMCVYVYIRIYIYQWPTLGDRNVIGHPKFLNGPNGLEFRTCRMYMLRKEWSGKLKRD